MAKVLRVERTGNNYSIASSEFRVIMDGGTAESIWSPPWHDMEPEEEEVIALIEAKKLFEVD